MKTKEFFKSLLFFFETTFLTKHMSNILDGQALTLIDIGAAGDIELRWKRVNGLLNYIGFEPDDRSYAELRNKLNKCRKYEVHKTALWSSKREINFHLCRGWQQSSHFQPNYDLVNKFPQKERFDVEKVGKFPAEPIDNLVQTKVDFIKIDTQGGELEILKGGKKTLDNVFGLELELGFAPIYTAQPLFKEIGDFLEKHDFIFVDFVSLRRWERHDINSSFGQLVFGDGLFMKSPEYISLTYMHDNAVINRYVAICCLYNRFDLVDTLANLTKTVGGNDTLWKSVNKLKRRANRFRKFHKVANIGAKVCGSEFSMNGIL